MINANLIGQWEMVDFNNYLGFMVLPAKKKTKDDEDSSDKDNIDKDIDDLDDDEDNDDMDSDDDGFDDYD